MLPLEDGDHELGCPGVNRIIQYRNSGHCVEAELVRIGDGFSPVRRPHGSKRTAHDVIPVIRGGLCVGWRCVRETAAVLRRQ